MGEIFRYFLLTVKRSGQSKQNQKKNSNGAKIQMMKKCIFFSFLVLFSIGIIAQENRNSVSFVSYWSLGDYYEFKVTKSSRQWSGDSLTKNENNSYLASFNVIDSTASGYVVKWVYENDMGSTYDFSEEVKASLAKYDSLEVIYKTTELGAFVEVLNWKEIGEMMGNLFDELKVALAKGDETKLKALDKSFKQLKKAYSSRVGVESVLLKELQYMHYPMGYEFKLQDTLRYEDQIPNVFGGSPIKGDTELHVDSVDFEQSFCVLKQHMKLNKDDAHKFMLQYVKKIYGSGKKVKRMLKSAIYAVEDENVFEFYYNPGVPHKIATRRETTMMVGDVNMRREDDVLIELRYQDPSFEQRNCAMFKTGKFLYQDSIQGNSHIERYGSKQIELDEKTGLKLELDVFWLDECTYSLRVAKVLDNPRNISIPPDMVVTSEIIETTAGAYLERVTSNLSKIILEKKMIKL